MNKKAIKKDDRLISPHSQGVTKNEIIVCNSAPITGAFATTGDPWNVGIRGYFDMVNANGGIDGRKIRFIHIDDGCDPNKAKAIFQKFLNDYKVFAYVGHFGSAVIAATIDDIRKSGMPAVYFGSGIGKLYVKNALTVEDGVRCFPVQPIYITEGQVIASRAIYDFGAAKIGIIYTDDNAGIELLEGVVSKCNTLNVEFCKEKVTAETIDAGSAVSAIKNKQVDIIVVAAIQATMPTIVNELAAQNVNKPVITSYVNASITIAAQFANNIKDKFKVYSSAWISYGDIYENSLEQASKWLGDYSMNHYSHCGWIAAHFFSEGLRRLKGQAITWEDYAKAMESAPIISPFGGSVDYSNGQRIGTQELTLYEIDMNSSTGWRETDKLKSVNNLLLKC